MCKDDIMLKYSKWRNAENNAETIGIVSGICALITILCTMIYLGGIAVSDNLLIRYASGIILIGTIIVTVGIIGTIVRQIARWCYKCNNLYDDYFNAKHMYKITKKN